MLLLLTEQPALQLVEIDVDNRRRIEGENLRQGEAADDGIAARLPNFRADPRTDDVALDAALATRAVAGAPVKLQWRRDDEFAWATSLMESSLIQI